MVDFSKLKNTSSQDAIKILKEKAAAQSGNNKKFDKDSNQDPRFWQPTADAAGNGFAIIRFLPISHDDDIPYVRVWDHGFQGPTGKWYIENSLTTIGEKDPVTEYTNTLWATKNKSDEELARKYKRRLHYISNIYIVSDPSNPDNNGKVFLYKYGKKIFDKINDCITPAFDEEGRPSDHPEYDPTSIQFDPFSPWEGANLRLKVRRVDGQRNFDQSAFDSHKPLFSGKDADEKIEAVWNKQYSLSEFVTKGSLNHLGFPHFKEYAALKARLDLVLGNVSESSDDSDKNSNKIASSPTPKLKETPAKKNPQVMQEPEDEDEESGEDSLEFFKKLAND